MPKIKAQPRSCDLAGVQTQISDIGTGGVTNETNVRVWSADHVLIKLKNAGTCTRYMAVVLRLLASRRRADVPVGIFLNHPCLCSKSVAYVMFEDMSNRAWICVVDLWWRSATLESIIGSYQSCPRVDKVQPRFENKSLCEEGPLSIVCYTRSFQRLKSCFFWLVVTHHQVQHTRSTVEHTFAISRGWKHRAPRSV